MIARKEKTKIILEIEFDVLFAELPIVENDLLRMTLHQFIQVYGPEMGDARMLIKMTDIKRVQRKPRDAELKREAIREEKEKAASDSKVQRARVRRTVDGDEAAIGTGSDVEREER